MMVSETYTSQQIEEATPPHDSQVAVTQNEEPVIRSSAHQQVHPRLPSLEIADDDEEDSLQQMRGRNRKEFPKWMVPFRYGGLALVAVILTTTCPGGTVVWRNGSNPTKNWLVLITISYILTVGGMLYLHWSDPGYISEDTLENLDDPLPTATTSVGQGDACCAVEEGSIVAALPTTTTSGGSHRRRPRSQDPGEEEEQQQLISSSTLFQGTRRKRCDICQLDPPLRAHHCSRCHRCVATYDHHCDLVGNCIGERNRAAFWWFLLVQATSFALLCHVMGSSRLGFVTFMQKEARQEEIYNACRVIVSKCYLYFLATMAYLMLSFHTFLIMGNLTTFEFRKGPRHLDYLRGTKDMDLPFSQGGCVGNIRRLCCGCGNLYQQTPWKPTLWPAPSKVVRDSEDWWEHPWQNKYWSCC